MAIDRSHPPCNLRRASASARIDALIHKYDQSYIMCDRTHSAYKSFSLFLITFLLVSSTPPQHRPSHCTCIFTAPVHSSPTSNPLSLTPTTTPPPTLPLPTLHNLCYILCFLELQSAIQIVVDLCSCFFVFCRGLDKSLGWICSTLVSGCTVWLKTLNLALMGGTPQHILFILFYVIYFIFIFIFVFGFPLLL